MPDPITIGSAISAASSVVGGLLGRNKAVKPGDVTRQTRAGLLGQASGARQASELYGFNPLTLLGVSQPLVPQAVDNSMMGQSIANAGLAIADGINAQSAQKAYMEKLEEQNQELRKALDGQTLRPKVPGIYGTPTPTAGVAGNVEVPVVPYTGGTVGDTTYNITSVDTGNLGKPSVEIPVSGDGGGDAGGDARGAPTATPIMQTYTHDGESISAPEFIDPGEMFAGAAALAALAYKKATKAKIFKHAQWVQRMKDQQDKNKRMVKTLREQGRDNPRGEASQMPSREPWWMTP